MSIVTAGFQFLYKTEPRRIYDKNIWLSEKRCLFEQRTRNPARIVPDCPYSHPTTLVHKFLFGGPHLGICVSELEWKTEKIDMV